MLKNELLRFISFCLVQGSFMRYVDKMRFSFVHGLIEYKIHFRVLKEHMQIELHVYLLRKKTKRGILNVISILLIPD